MRILVLADIHSNWPALQAVRESFDACLVLGDIVDYGGDPVSCIEWIRTNATTCIRGNHDHAVAQRIAARAGSGVRRLAEVTRPIHWRLLSGSRIQFLARLPVTKRLTLGGRSFYLVHATPRDPLDEYLTGDPDAWKSRLESVEADFVCVGHTHIPYHLDLGSVQVINPGSVGQPRDGDPRCSYAIIEDGKVELKRVPYDIDAAVHRMREVGVDEETLQLAERILRTGGQVDGFQPNNG